MSRVPLNLLKGASLLAIMAGLAACSGGHDDSSGGGVATVQPVDTLANLYGVKFAADFRMAPTATPVPVPVAGDIVPLSLTTQPNALF